MKILRFLPSRWWSWKAWKSWNTYLHWRMETYGVYYPDHKFHFAAWMALIRQFPSYWGWLSDLEKLHQKSSSH